MKRSMADWDGTEVLSIGGIPISSTRRHVLHLVFQAADSVSCRPVGGAVPAPVLRSAVLYSLVLNLCSTEEIVEASENDAVLNYLCANYSLDWSAVHEFRRRNNLQLRDTLATVFAALLSRHEQIPRETVARAEADARIRRAVQADSMVLDL